jgi:hypothetical protein
MILDQRHIFLLLYGEFFSFPNNYTSLLSDQPGGLVKLVLREF